MSSETPMKRPDYFMLSIYAGQGARRIATLLGANGAVVEEAEDAAAAGFVLPDPTVLIQASTIFAALGQQPGGGSALSADTIDDRVSLLCAVAGHLQGMNEAVDLRWSTTWAAFMTPDVRKAFHLFRTFAADHRADPEGTRKLLEADWQRHYDEERSSR